jgi:hypothetical protein
VKKGPNAIKKSNMKDEFTRKPVPPKPLRIDPRLRQRNSMSVTGMIPDPKAMTQNSTRLNNFTSDLKNMTMKSFEYSGNMWATFDEEKPPSSFKGENFSDLKIRAT